MRLLLSVPEKILFVEVLTIKNPLFVASLYDNFIPEL
jgi:hypothetical protein